MSKNRVIRHGAGVVAGVLVAAALLTVGGSASALTARTLSLDLLDEAVGSPGRLPRVVVDGETERAFALNRLGDQVVTYDVSGDAVAQTTNVTVGANPFDMAINTVTHQLVVTDEVANNVKVIDVKPGSPTNNTVLTTIPATASGPAAIAVDETENTAYFVADSPPSVGQMNLATGATTLVPLLGATSITVDSATHTAYVSTAAGNLVAVADGAVVADSPLAKTFTSVHFSDGLLYAGVEITTGSYKIETYDAGLNFVGASPVLSDKPIDIRVDADLQLVYVLGASGDLRAFRIGELAPEGPADLTGTDNTAAFAVDTDSHRVYTTIPGLTGFVFRMWDLEASPLVTTATLPNGQVGVSYSQQIQTVAWPSASSFTLTGAGTLPPGLLLNATTGAITNTPTTAGTYTFSVSASNGIGMPAMTGYTIVIQPSAGTAPTITSGQPTGATVGTQYSFFVTATGMPAATYAVTFGTLPDGLTLNATTGELRGKPTVAGTKNFTITASNAAGSDSAELTLTVAPAVVPTPTPTPTPTPSPQPTTTPQPTAGAGGNNSGTSGTGGSSTGSGAGSGSGVTPGRLASTGSDGLAALGGVFVAFALGASGVAAFVTTVRRRRP